MTKISDQTLEMFDQIYRGHVGVRGIFSDTEDLKNLLVKIEESGDVFAIPGLLLFLLKMNKTRAIVIAETIDHLLRQIPINKLPQFDEQVRTVYQFMTYPKYLSWYKVTPLHVREMVIFEEFAPSLLGVCSFHNNGYVRDSATIVLAGIRDGSEIPYLLLRVNDWVPEIREVAREAMLVRCKPEYAQHFTRNLPLVMRLESCNRSDHTNLINSIVSQLLANDSWDILLAVIQSGEMVERRAAFNIAIRSANAGLKKQAIYLGIQSQDELIRVRSAQKVNLITNPVQLEDALSVLRVDPFMPVRLAALRHSIELSTGKVIEELEKALLDKHISIREFVRYHLNKMEPMDFREYYREALNAGSKTQIYAAIGGLGETGVAEDDVFVLPFVNHRFVRIRAAALRALANLNLHQHTQTFLVGLEDESPKVSREAARSLSQSRDFVSHQEEIWGLIAQDSASHVKLNALSLLCRLSKWDSIYYLLKSAGLDNKLLKERSTVAMRAWWFSFNRSFTEPNEFQKNRIREEMAKRPSKGEFIFGESRFSLEFILQSFE